MKLSFVISNSKLLKKLFSLSADYINVCVSESIIIFYLSQGELFTSAVMALSDVDGFNQSDNCNFRIPKRGFLSIVEDGICSVLMKEDKISLQIINSDHTHIMSFARQVCNLADLSEKLELIDNCKHYPKVSLGDLGLIAKLARTDSKPLTIADGFAFTQLGGLQLYSRTKCSDMAFFPTTLNYFLSAVDDFSQIYNVRNYIVYSEGSYGILLNKITGLNSGDIDFVRKQAPLFKANINFESALSLISKVRDYDTATIDLRLSQLRLTTSDAVSYSSPISIQVKEKEKTLEELLDSVDNTPTYSPEVDLTIDIFKSIIYLAKAKELEMSVCRRIIKIKVSDNTLLVCRNKVSK